MSRSLIGHCCAVLLVYSVGLTEITMAGTVSQRLSTGTNLSSITWAHAVNSQKLLTAALDSDVMMIEADIVLGVLVSNPDTKPFPVMGHPPEHISDISLEKFLLTIFDFNQKQPKEKEKGVKLDFKSIEVFESSIEILDKLYNKINFPLWINADILPGPIGSKVKPVDAERFLLGAKQFFKSTLSIGWTTLYSKDLHVGSYTDQMITDMLEVISSKGIKHNITFPLRAGLMAQSSKSVLRLIEKLRDSTVTVWSSAGDPVNVEDLRKLIFTIGLNRVYVDVPEELRKELHLDQPPF